MHFVWLDSAHDPQAGWSNISGQIFFCTERRSPAVLLLELG
jgi:hypothetical protein